MKRRSTKPKKPASKRLKKSGKGQAALIQRLKQIPFFETYSDKEIASITHCIEEKKVLAQTSIFEEGSADDSFYLIEKGKVLIYKGKVSERRQDIAVLMDGDFFGEMSFVEAKPRSANAKTLEDTLLVVIRARHLLNWVKRDMKLAFSIGAKLVRGMSERLRQTTEEFNNLGQLTALLINAKNHEEVWGHAAREMARIVPPDVAGGGVLLFFNPYIEEYMPMGHWGSVPSEYLVGRPTLDKLESGSVTYPLGSDLSRGCILIFNPHERRLYKQAPLIQTYADLVYQAITGHSVRYEDELRNRLKNQSVSI